MILRGSIRRLAALAAAFAVVLQALWPLVAHARPQSPSLLVPVCTVGGSTHYLDLKSGKSPLDERAALHGDHCKLCFFGGDKDAAFSPNSSKSFFIANLSDSKAIPRLVSDLEPATRTQAQPRAPPQAS